ncbi:MAG: DUF3426 domain-containing protein, partial [Duodenibacillus sp.]|nr:DUF3426 domain-containing protein [Duodenibacillus sp.]
ASDQGGSHGLLALLVLLAIAGAAAAAFAVYFNQQIIERWPRLKPVYAEACQKIPCPGFYLSNIEAFAVTGQSLEPGAAPGAYDLAISLVNGSGVAQAVPSLSIELVDERDATLMTIRRTPAEYLSDPATRFMMPGRPLTVRFQLQTAARPARCIVRPFYP